MSSGQCPLLSRITNQILDIITIDFNATQLALISYLTNFPKFPFDILCVMSKSTNEAFLIFIRRNPQNILFGRIYFTILNSCNHFSHI